MRKTIILITLFCSAFTLSSQTNKQVEDGLFKMYYSFRNAHNYRNNPNKSYRLGYAESKDGLSWNRKDNELNLFEQKSNWDNIMNEYCTIYSLNGIKYLIYNGNGFGKTGFGYAIQK